MTHARVLLAAAFLLSGGAALSCSQSDTAESGQQLSADAAAETEPADGGPEPDVHAEGGPDALEPRFEALDKQIEAERKQRGAPGAAVAVVENGKVTYARGFGVKHADGAEPVLPTTLFRIGSMTKVMTATAVMQLAGAGVVDLQEPVPTYVPDFHFTKNPQWAPSIQGHHLLTHQSAMVDYLELDWPDHSDTAIDYLAGPFAKIMYLMAPSGRFFNYANPNFIVAGWMAERLTDLAYPDLMKQKVWQPLGMNRTFFTGEDVTADGDFAHGKTVDWETGKGTVQAGPMDYDNPWARPAGYAWSSVLDLARFASFLLHGNEAVLGNAQLQALKSKQVNTLAYLDLYWYGYGLFVEEGSFVDGKYYAVQVIEHGGDIPGFAADMFLVPSRDLAVIALASADGAHLSKSIGVALQTLGGVQPSAPPDPQVDPAKFKDYAGEYQDKYNVGTLVFTTDGTELSVAAGDLDKAGIGYDKQLYCYVRDTCLLTIYQGGQPFQLPLTFVLDGDGNGEFARTRVFVATRVQPSDGGVDDGGAEAGVPDAGSGSSKPPPYPAAAPDPARWLSRLRAERAWPAIGIPQPD